MRTTDTWQILVKAISATGTDDHIDWLIDLICSLVPHDLITVTC